MAEDLMDPEDDRDPFHCDCGKPKSSDKPMCPPCMGEPDCG
jgi:hypothetical protein